MVLAVVIASLVTVLGAFVVPEMKYTLLMLAASTV